MARENHHRWLHGQLAAWRQEGLLDAEAADRIAARHPVEPDRPGIPLLLTLGAVLAGIGVIWLIAANLELDEVGPWRRIAFVTAAWLALVVAAEALAARERWAGVAPALRLLAALAYGGVVFQAAQSLQVPAYSPHLLFAWGAGALAYAYAVRGRAALTLGVGVLGGWYVWALGESGGDGTAFILGLAVACPVAAALAALQDGDFGAPWRFAAAAFGLLALGTAAIPEAAGEPLPSTGVVVAGALAAVLLTAGAAARAPDGRAELAGAAAVALAAALLVLVAPEDTTSFGSGGDVSGAQTAYTLVACALFLGAAVGVAFAGVTRERPGLANLAYGALLLFLAVQSFGLLATLTSGAVLLLGVGGVLLVAGIVLDRGRRRLIEEAG